MGDNGEQSIEDDFQVSGLGARMEGDAATHSNGDYSRKSARPMEAH